LGQLGAGLASLVNGLGKVYPNTVIVVMSEFGRTLRENGNGGTDHGHGNVMWVFGGIRGGKIYGEWTGLSPEQLYQNRDLAIATDFRDVLAPILKHHLNLDAAKLAKVFPNYAFQQNIPLVV
jgi:uncharacterized protein (DUF1501 family)